MKHPVDILGHLLADLTVGITSTIYSAGLDDCGTQYTAEAYHISAEDKHGNRWMHPYCFATSQRKVDDDGSVYFTDDRVTAKAMANKLLARMVRAEAVDLSIWNEDHPAYGSKAYQAYGAANDCYEDRFGDQD